MVVSGYIGMAINCQSFCDSFRICITSDEGLVSEADNRSIVENIERQIRSEMERTKDFPLDINKETSKTSNHSEESSSSETKKDK